MQTPILDRKITAVSEEIAKITVLPKHERDHKELDRLFDKKNRLKRWKNSLLKKRTS